MISTARRRAIILSAVLTAALGVGGASFWYLSKPAEAKAQQCEAIRSAVKQRGSLVKVASGSPITAIIGDSYSAGDELADRSKGWAYGLRGTVTGGIVVDGIGATGFINGGYCETDTFGSRIPRVLSAKPSTVIIQGGLNDVQSTPRDVELAARTILARLADVERVVVVGPVDSPGREGEAAVDTALRKAAKAAGREYVSALSWNLGFLPDRTHLTEAGHAAFAANVASALTH